jgi:hypothetical protein
LKPQISIRAYVAGFRCKPEYMRWAKESKFFLQGPAAA